MWEIKYELRNLLMPQINGYEFIKSIKLYVPYEEIGLNILVRKELPLPFFYEEILKLIDCRCNDVWYISKLTGVEEEIINDVIGEMSVLELIYIRGNRISLTTKGIIALKNLKSTQIEKEELNRIYIDAITGEIVELENHYNIPEYMCPCLDDTIKISEEYIINRFNEFNELYQKRQESLLNVSRASINEIYQLTGLVYERLCYSELNVLIYKNLRDNDLIFKSDNEHDNVYCNYLAKQIKCSTGARRFLLNKYECDKYKNYSFSIEDVKKDNTNKLISFIEKNNSIDKSNIEDLELLYFTNRYLIDNEYIDILLNLKNIKPTEIVISSNHLNKVLNQNIIAAIHKSFDYSSATIISDIHEHNINKTKNLLLNVKQNKHKIKWVDSIDIVETNIILYPQCFINIKYIPIKVDNDYIIKELAEINFNKEFMLDQKNILLNINDCNKK